MRLFFLHEGVETLERDVGLEHVDEHCGKSQGVRTKRVKGGDPTDCR